mmetsp:Transcript_24949/g.57633  ORF Transcript_24949/g.57633 Transcript_24949/m.57633 type:complete len:409 (-) Transcript_24949:19-1245(-)
MKRNCIRLSLQNYFHLLVFLSRRNRQQDVTRCGLGDLQLLLVHIRGDGREERSGQVALSGIRQHAHDDAPLRRLLGRLNGGPHGGSSGDAREDALRPGQILRGLHGDAVRNGNVLVHELQIHALLQDQGDEVGGPSLDGVGLEGGVGSVGAAVGVAFGRDARVQKVRGAGFREDYLGVRTGGFDVFSGPVEGSAGAVSRHPVIELSAVHALEIVADLRTRGFFVEFPVGVRLELMAQKPAVFFGQFRGLFHHARAFAGFGRDDDAGAQHAHQFASLDGEGLRHGDDTFVPSLGAHHRHGDAGVAAGGLDHRVPGLQLAFFFGSLDDGQRQPILHGRQRIEVFALGVDGAALRTETLVDLHHGSVAHGLADVLEGGTVALPAFLTEVSGSRFFRHVADFGKHDAVEEGC